MKAPALGDEQAAEDLVVAQVAGTRPGAGDRAARFRLGPRQFPGGDQDPGDHVEGGGVEEERRLHAEPGDDQPGQARPERRPRGEGDVEDRVALAQFARRLEHAGDHRPGQRPACQRQGAIDRRQGDHQGKREVGGEQGERAEGRRLAAIDQRQGDPWRRPLDPGYQDRGQESGQEAGAEEEDRGRQRAFGRFVDEDREGDDPHPVAHLIERIGGRQPPEQGATQGRGYA